MPPFRTRIGKVTDKATGRSITILRPKPENLDFKRRALGLVDGEEIEGWFVVAWGKDIMPLYSFERGSFSILELIRFVDRVSDMLLRESIDVVAV